MTTVYMDCSQYICLKFVDSAKKEFDYYRGEYGITQYYEVKNVSVKYL